MHPHVQRAIRPVYLAAGGRHATFREAVEACPALDLDYEGINCFLRTGLYLKGRTPFAQVRRETHLPTIVPTRRRSRRQASLEYAEVFRQAVRERITDGAVIGLSGGADSRHILLELVRLDRRPKLALTVDLPGLGDAEVARRLTADLRVPHRVIAPADEPADEVRKCDSVDFMSLQHRWFMAVADQIGNGAWWDGIAGDVLSAGLFLERWNLELMQSGSFEAYAERLVHPGRLDWFGPGGRFDRDQAIHDLTEELKLHAEAANPVGSFYFWNRTCIDIASAPFGILERSGARALAPYLDRQVWECLMSLPADLLLDHQFHVQTIRAAYPESADLPYASKRPVPRAVTRGLALRVAPLLWQQWRQAGSISTLKAFGGALRSAATGAGDPGGLLAQWAFAHAASALVNRSRKVPHGDMHDA